jgi:catechol 2,3-dioxygenase-like lactoylglutathione lyase family enzyme
MKFGSIVPLLRMFDIPATRAFYVDYMGFGVDFEHRFEPELPLYMQVSRGACRLHLTQHHGDCCPGSAVRIDCDDVLGLHTELVGKAYNFLRPGVQSPLWGGTELTLIAPAGNRLVFVQRVEGNG